MSVYESNEKILKNLDKVVEKNVYKNTETSNGEDLTFLKTNESVLYASKGQNTCRSTSKTLNFLNSNNNYVSFPMKNVQPDDPLFHFDETSNENDHNDDDIRMKVKSRINLQNSSLNKNEVIKSSIEIENEEYQEANEQFFEEEEKVKNNNKLKEENILISIDDKKHNGMIQNNFENGLKNDSKFYDAVYEEKRTQLPMKRVIVKFSLWSIFKKLIGKDLSKFAAPVYINEPMSMLQKICENFQYAELLNKAALETDPYIRLAYIGAFCVSMHSLNPNKTTKFFNPLLGETYEYIDNNLKFRYFAEQVSHHPPITACHVEGEGYNFIFNTNVRPNFKIFKSALEIHKLSRAHLKFSNGDIISFNTPINYIRNIILGPYIDYYGNFNVINHITGDYAEMEVIEADSLLKNQGRVRGKIKNSKGEIIFTIEGNWLEGLNLINSKTKIETNIWKKFPILPNEEERYYFSDFAVNLNNINENLQKVLPHTDSRLRPDQRALEYQDYKSAANEKDRLENKQRASRKYNEENNITWKPKYFIHTIDEVTHEPVYKFCRDYWKDRIEKNFSDLDHIY